MKPSEVRRGAAHRLRAGAARVLTTSGLARFSANRAQGLRILMYHGLRRTKRGPATWGNLFLDVDAFARQIHHVRQTFDPVSLDDVAEFLEHGRPLSPRAVAITFDDGYASVLTDALPILMRERVPATVFVCAEVAGAGQCHWFDALRLVVWHCEQTGATCELDNSLRIEGPSVQDPEEAFTDLSKWIGEREPEMVESIAARLNEWVERHRLLPAHPELQLADWAQWREAAATGRLSIGSHGLRHADLTRVSPEAARQQLRESRELIEQALGRPCLWLAYPYGHCTPALAESAADAGYRLAVTTEDGLNAAAQPRLMLRRTMIGDRGDYAVFRARVSGAWTGVRGLVRGGAGPAGPRRSGIASPSGTKGAEPPHPPRRGVSRPPKG